MTSENPTQLRDWLAKLTPEEVREQAAQLKREADELDRQARALFAMADALAGELGAADQPGETTPTGNGKATARPKPSNKRPLILQVIGERPKPAWTAKEVHSTLISRDLIDANTTLESIRVTLHRMVDRYDQLARTEDSRFMLPDDQGRLDEVE